MFQNKSCVQHRTPIYSYVGSTHPLSKLKNCLRSPTNKKIPTVKKGPKFK